VLCCCNRLAVLCCAAAIDLLCCAVLQDEGASRHIIPLAARLLGIEQGIPFDALPDAHQDAEVWAAWE
jgi:hypothetical protein